MPIGMSKTRSLNRKNNSIMKEKTFTIVTTTINIPILLEDYAKDALKFNRKINEFIVVGDRKSPVGTADFCSGLEKKYSIKFIYLSLEKQEEYLEKFPEFRNYLKPDHLERRNVGFLMAYFNNSDIVVTIDDDNFLEQEDYFGFHSHLGEEQEIEAVSSSNGWWNVCEMLAEEKNIPFYHRGYPLSKRWQDEKTEIKKRKGKVVVNAGLWLEEPDIDAFTRFAFPIKIIGKSKLFKEKVACEIETWAPFNTQNTAVAREVLPAYFLSCEAERNHDIWASYVVRRISDHLGHFVTYGSPLVRQKRNPHSKLYDFETEKFTMGQNDHFIKALQMCDLKGNSYKECFKEIADQLYGKFEEIWEKDPLTYRNDIRKDIESVCKSFKLWSEIF